MQPQCKSKGHSSPPLGCALGLIDQRFYLLHFSKKSIPSHPPHMHIGLEACFDKKIEFEYDFRSKRMSLVQFCIGNVQFAIEG